MRKALLALYLLCFSAASTKWFDPKILKEVKAGYNKFCTRILFMSKFARNNIKSELNDVHSVRTGRSKKVKVWRSTKIPIELSSRLTKHEQRHLACAFLFFREHTCVKFIPRNPKKHNDYIKITNNRPRCFSSDLGRKGGKQEINLNKNEAHCWKHGVIIHQLLHAFGFYHEQSRFDRRRYVTIHWKNLPSIYRKSFKTATELGINTIKLGSYDYGSVMHTPRFLLENSADAVISSIKSPNIRNNIKMGNRQIPSQLDILKIRKLFKCPTPPKPPKIYLIGGNNDSPHERRVALSTVEILVPGKSQEHVISEAEMLTARMGHVAGVVEGKIIVAGGTSNGKILKSTEIFYPKLLQWRAAPKLRQKRTDSAGATVGKSFFVCAGWNKKKELRTCEHYSSKSKRWAYTPRMKTPRRFASAAAIGQYLYIIGGSKNKKELNSVERYNTKKKKWRKMSSMIFKREGAAALTWNGYIVVCGGEMAYVTIRSCEKYNPIKNKWSLFGKDMKYRRSHLALVAYGKNLYALAGWFIAVSRHSEIWKNKRWTDGPELLTARREFAAVVL